MLGVVAGAAAVIVVSAGWSEAGGPDSGTGETRGAAFAGGSVGPVGGTCAGGSGDTTGASGTFSLDSSWTFAWVFGARLPERFDRHRLRWPAHKNSDTSDPGGYRSCVFTTTVEKRPLRSRSCPSVASPLPDRTPLLSCRCP